MLLYSQSLRVPHSCASISARMSGMNIARSARILLAALAPLLLYAAAAHAQLPAPPATTEDALHQMFDQAGIVFTGQVTAIRHIASVNDSSGVVEVDFAVENAFRGSTSSGIYTLREWAGLAPNADAIFTVGRRYLVLLHAPGPSGLTSAVGGSDGIIPILPVNGAASATTPDAIGLAAQASLARISDSPAHTNLRIAPIQTDSSVAALASANVDLRWIAARVLSPLAYAPSEPAAARPIVARAYSIRSSTNFLAPETDRTAVANSNPSTPPVTTDAPRAASSSNYVDMLTLLHSWQKSARDASGGH